MYFIVYVLVFSDAALLLTFSRYKQFGTKLSVIFRICQIFQIQTNFSIKPNPQIACSVCYWLVVLSKLQLNRKFFTLLLAKSNFHVSAFRLVIFGVLFSIIYFSIYKFCAKKSSFCFSSFCWQIPIFTLLLFRVSVGKFQFSRFCFSDFNFSSFCWQIPIFTLLLCKLFAETNVYFLIVFICVISAQVSSN